MKEMRSMLLLFVVLCVSFSVSYQAWLLYKGWISLRLPSSLSGTGFEAVLLAVPLALVGTLLAAAIYKIMPSRWRDW